MIKKYITAIIFMTFVFPIPVNATQDCLTLSNFDICVGESHDSVIQKLDKKFAVGQFSAADQNGLVVSRTYNYKGKIFTLTFGRTSPESPYRLLQIINAENAAKSDDTHVKLQTVMVVLADGDRYLTMGLDAETKDDKTMVDIQNNMPKIRDATIILLSQKTYADIATPDGKIALKNEILERLNNLLGYDGIERLYFTEFTVQ